MGAWISTGAMNWAFARCRARMTPFLQQLKFELFGPPAFKWIGPLHDS
jgi:hypothetical protein